MFTLPAFAKINWDLRVLGRRDDGLHEIRTIFQTVSLRDDLTFETANEIVLTCDAPHVPVDETNLIARAANCLRARFSVSEGARIHLAKRIPSPGGLGGGSSDAATALIGLTRLWRIEATKTELIEIGATLGADVPFFLFGGTALGIGLGTTIEPLPDATKILLLIVTPPENVLTKDAYRSLNAPRLTAKSKNDILTICRFETENLDSLETNLHNDFENTIFRLKPEIARVKQSLLDAKAKNALLSGSGASVFGIFENETTRAGAARFLRAIETDWQVFECETVSRGEFQSQMFQSWNFHESLL